MRRGRTLPTLFRSRWTTQKSKNSTTRFATRKLLTVNRLAGVGNCQAAPLANCLRRANPKLEINVIAAARRNNPAARKAAMENLASADIILAQPGGGELFGSSLLGKQFRNVMLYPKL